ncbi:histidine kinase [Bordetella sputigena]|uniref:response regulator n=1 Tax=Bordetella sputigena TaxID=1416810 RepID=UPI0039EF7B26
MILLLEDNDLDAELMMHHLADALRDMPLRRVHDRRSYGQALDDGDISLVISDFSLPDIDGWEALSMAARKLPEVPFIFVSGVIGEDLAVKALKTGATDYVLKQRLERLGGAARRALSEAEDRRERRRVEVALRDSEVRFRALSDSAPALIWETDASGKVIFVNRHYEVMFGLPSSEMLGQGWYRMVYEPDMPALLKAFDQAVREQKPLQLEIRVIDAQRRLRWLDCRGVPRFDGVGRFLGLTGTNIDVTDAKLARDELEQIVQSRTAELLRTNERLLQEMRQRADADAAREQAEEQLRQAQKMEAFGQLTGGVAHDFNNFLTVILGNLETLERQLLGGAGAADGADPGRVETALSHAKQGAQRAAVLTQRLLAFARRQPLQPSSVNVNELIAATAEMLTRMLGEEVDLRNDLQDDIWPAHIDPHMLESALLNLAVNARDAMPDGGQILIQTRNTVLDERTPGLGAQPGDYIRISLSDTGVGIPEDLIEKVFEPFFTTKDIGVGTGLGLSQVYGFVKQSGGYVAIDSSVGVGTTVHIYLPRQVGAWAAASERAHDGALPVAARGETILVVEDDEAVRAHSASALTELGYKVHQAADAMTALRRLRESDDISLLFTDVGLPRGMNGRDLAEAARAVRPGLRVLYTSAYAEGTLTHDGKLPPGVALIPKPFTFSALAQRVREVLDRASPNAAAATGAGSSPLPAQAGQAPAVAAPGVRGARVLIVEDDNLVRELTSEALTDFGYEVAEAGTAAQALSTMENNAAGVGAAIVDLGLPDMPGKELIRRLAERHPGLPILVASGYGKVELDEGMPAATRVAFIQKPYELDGLYAALRDLGVTPS